MLSEFIVSERTINNTSLAAGINQKNAIFDLNPKAPLLKRAFPEETHDNNSKSITKKFAKAETDLDYSFLNMRGANVVCEMLLKNNVEYLFGYNGGAILSVMDTVCSANDMKFILPRHEQGAGFMAEGYARATGKPGVVIVTSGPGATNIITALNDAFFDGVPLVVFTGQVSTAAIGTDAFQEADIIGMTRCCTKWNTMVKDVTDLPHIINKAFSIATSGRPGPVLIDLPVNISDSVITKPISSSKFNSTHGEISLHMDQDISNQEVNILKSVKMINNSEKPVIYVGQGILNHPDGPKLLASLSNNGNIPVTTTLHALGSFDEEDPKSLRMLGSHGTCYANLAIKNADLIIALGARFDNRAIGPVKEFAPEAIKSSKENRGGIIHFEILPKNMNKVVKADVVVQGDVTENLKKLLPHIKGKERKGWFEIIDQWKKQYPFYYEKTVNDDEALKPQQVIEEFEQQIKNIKEKVIVTTGVGNHQIWAANIIKWKHPHSFISSGGFGTMGYGLPAAIGVKIAKPDHIVVDIDGDSSFSMSAMELATAAEFNIGVKVIIMNNSSQGMVKQLQDISCERRYSATCMKNPDFFKLTESMGIKAIRVSKVSELEEKMAEFLDYDGPIVMDVITSDDERLYPMVSRLNKVLLHPVIMERNLTV